MIIIDSAACTGIYGKASGKGGTVSSLSCRAILPYLTNCLVLPNTLSVAIPTAFRQAAFVSKEELHQTQRQPCQAILK